MNHLEALSVHADAHHDLVLLRAVYEGAPTVDVAGSRVTVNEFSDQINAIRPDLIREVTAALAAMAGDYRATTLLTEEDKGSILGTAMCLALDLPLAVARWYPYCLEEHTQIEVPMACEYREGRLYVNGIRPGDRVLIIEDTVATGGTCIALIHAVRAAGAAVVGVLAAIEKIDRQGVRRITAETGVEVRTLLPIVVDPQTKRVRVTDRHH